MGVHRRTCTWQNASRSSGAPRSSSFCDHIRECDADVCGFPRHVTEQRAIPLSSLPIALSGEAIHAVVVGGGAVATRKALTLCDAGAKVTVIAPEISEDLSRAASSNARISLEQRRYAGANDLADADIVFAATDSERVNEAVAADAREIHRLVNVVSDGSKGSFVSMATHRDGQVTIGVTAGGQPREAMRIRDSIARRLRQVERD